jgi:altronate hydrolase
VALERMTEGEAPPILRLDDSDNVAVALVPLETGIRVEVGDISLTVAEDVPVGHKLALTTIEEGEPVLKFGSMIGEATSRIPAGSYVHVHNLASARLRGDR